MGRCHDCDAFRLELAKKEASIVYLKKKLVDLGVQEHDVTAQLVVVTSDGSVPTPGLAFNRVRALQGAFSSSLDDADGDDSNSFQQKMNVNGLLKGVGAVGVDTSSEVTNEELEQFLVCEFTEDSPVFRKYVLLLIHPPPPCSPHLSVYFLCFALYCWYCCGYRGPCQAAG